MALNAADTARKELDKAVADVERKRKLLATCKEREEQAKTATVNAASEVDEAIAMADWLASHPLLQAEDEPEPAFPIAESDPVEPVKSAEEIVAEHAIEIPEAVQTTVEQQLAEATPAPAGDVEDLFATA